MANKKYDVIIVGAGLVGAACALTLARQSELKIAVVERSEALTESSVSNQRVVALGAVATQVLSKIGVFEKLGIEHCYPYQKMFVWDQGSDGELQFEADQLGEDSLGHMIDAMQCTFLLQQALENEKSIDVYYDFQATSICFDLPLGQSQVAQIVSEEQELLAHLMVAADGNRSWVRQQAKIFAPEQNYKQLGIVAKVESELKHSDTAWQRFLPSGPLAMLPLARNHCSIVWSADEMKAEQLIALSDQEFCSALSDAMEHKLGSIELRSKRLAFSLKSQQAETYHKRNLVLIGDAAHSIHPLAGQGANLGFKDVVSLAAVLENLQSDQLGNPNELEKYQRARILDNKQTDMFMSLLHRAYQSDLPLWLGLRGVGMNWVNKSSTLKHLITRQAAGL